MKLFKTKFTSMNILGFIETAKADLLEEKEKFETERKEINEKIIKLNNDREDVDSKLKNNKSFYEKLENFLG